MTELRYLEDTVIGVLSMGAQRPWSCARSRAVAATKTTTAADVIDLSPASGDLLVMGGRCQAAYLHAVPKLTGRVRSRISAVALHVTPGPARPDPGYYAPRHFSR